MPLNAKLYATLTGHTGSIYTVAGTDGGLYTTRRDGLVTQWDIAQPDHGLLAARMGMQIFSMALLPNKKQMLLGQMQGGIHVLDLAAKQETRHLALHKQGVFDLLATEHHFLAVGGDGVLSLWRQDDCALQKSIHLSGNSLRSIALHLNGELLAIGSSDHNTHLLSYPDLQPLRQLQGHQNSVFTTCFSPDGRYLVSGSRDAHLMVWDVQDDFKPLHRIPAHLATINHIVYSPDGKLFATAGRDKDVKVWDAQTFQLLKVLDRHKFDGHVNSVNRLYWGAKYLCSASDDRTVKLWEV